MYDYGGPLIFDFYYVCRRGVRPMRQPPGVGKLGVGRPDAPQRSGRGQQCATFSGVVVMRNPPSLAGGACPLVGARVDRMGHRRCWCLMGGSDLHPDPLLAPGVRGALGRVRELRGGHRGRERELPISRDGPGEGRPMHRSPRPQGQPALPVAAITAT